MKRFECQACGTEVFFDNSVCTNCGSRLGFDPHSCEMEALQPNGNGWAEVSSGKQVKLCANADDAGCNWLVSDPNQSLCQACRHNETIPDLSVPQNAKNWGRIEAAKKRLFYAIRQWNLPCPTKKEDAERGLSFRFLADEFDENGNLKPVMTGHANGVITLNIAEGDDAEREKRRANMGEPYRTLVGHFRHEIGHYYWDRLVADEDQFHAFRAVFGDEREDYNEALRRHYENGPPADWSSRFISAYASSHPWEDFAETFAHYAHMVDVLDTAQSFGMAISPKPGSAARTRIECLPYKTELLDRMLDVFVPTTIAINALNRSVGQPDLYPFVLSDLVAQKLEFVHAIIRAGSVPRA